MAKKAAAPASEGVVAVAMLYPARPVSEGPGLLETGRAPTGSAATPQPALAAMGKVAGRVLLRPPGRGRRFASAKGMCAAVVMGNFFLSSVFSVL
jgi:hypothetical protein